MIPLLIRKNRVSIVIILVLGLGFFASLAFWIKEAKRSSSVSQEYASIKSGLEDIISRGGSTPSEELIKYLNEKKKLMEEKDQTLWAAIEIPETRMPEEIPDPLEFKDTLMKTQERLRKRAMEEGLFMPHSLGFAGYEAVIPREERIPFLAKQLSFFEDLIILLIQTGVIDVEKLEFSFPRDVEIKEMGGGSFYREFPFILTITLPSSRLGVLFYRLRCSPYILIVDRVKITEFTRQQEEYSGTRRTGLAGPGSRTYLSDEKMVSVTLLISLFVFLK